MFRDSARLVFLVAGSILAGLVAVGIPLAIVGLFRPYLVLPGAAIVAGVLIWVTGPRTEGDPEQTGGWSFGIVVLVAIGVFVLFAGKYSSEHVMTNRDPGIHVNAAWWLAGQGSLVMDTGLTADELEAFGPLVDWGSQGVHRAEAGDSYFQGVHALPVVMALGQWLGGDWLMFKVPALIAGVGLLAAYLLARAIVGYRWALAALLVLLVHPVSLHLAKDSYTEWLMAVFVIGGLYLWASASDSNRWIGGFVAGLFLGLAAAVRIDAWAVFIGFLLGLAWYGISNARTRPWTPVVLPPLAGLALGGAIGLLDLVLRSPRYLSDLWSSALPMFAVSGIAALAAVAAAWLGSHVDIGSLIRPSTRRFLAVGAGLAVAGAGLTLLWIRPLIEQAHQETSIGLVAALQTREGLAVDGTRTYAELSAQWLSWYQGELFVSAVAILAGVVGVWLVLGNESRLRPIYMSVGVVAALYLLRPSITPDHLWAIRRFLPVVIPLLVLLFVWGLQILLRSTSNWMHRGVQVGGSLVVASTVLIGLVVGWPLARLDTQVGMLSATHRMCAALPEDAVAAVDTSTSLALILPAALRARCDVSVVRFVGRDAPGGLEAAQVTAAGIGKTLILVEPDTVQSAGVEIHRESLTYSFPRRVLSEPPRQAETEVFSVRLVGPALVSP